MHQNFRFAIAVKIHAIEIVMRGHIAKLPLQIEHLNNLLFYQAICFLFGLNNQLIGTEQRPAFVGSCNRR